MRGHNLIKHFHAYNLICRLRQPCEIVWDDVIISILHIKTLTRSQTKCVLTYVKVITGNGQKRTGAQTVQPQDLCFSHSAHLSVASLAGRTCPSPSKLRSAVSPSIRGARRTLTHRFDPLREIPNYDFLSLSRNVM